MMAMRFLNLLHLFLLVILASKQPTRCLRLEITPREPTLHLYTGDVFTAQCVVVDDSGRPPSSSSSNYKVSRWISPSGDRVSHKESQRVVSEKDENDLFLVIKHLEPADAGSWRCEADSPPLSAAFTIALQSKPVIDANERELAPLNQRHLIKCLVRSDQEVRVTWRKQDRLTNIDPTNDPDYEISPLGLTIRQVRLADNDTFFCMAENLINGYFADKAIQVLVSRPVSNPYITCVTTPCALEKAFSMLYCHSDGLPPPRFEWSFNQRYIIKHGSDRKYYLDHNALTISNLSTADSGLYECRAFSDYDTTGKRTRFNLEVLIPPEIHPMTPLTMHMSRPSASELICNVSSRSSGGISFAWYKDGRAIADLAADVLRIDRRDSYVSRLRFVRPHKAHFGVYACEASNAGGSGRAEASVIVEYAAEFDAASMPTLYYGVDGRPVNLSCAFDGFPVEDVIWTNPNRAEYLDAEFVSADGFKVLRIYDFSEGPQRVLSTITLLTNSLHLRRREIEIECAAGDVTGTRLRLVRAGRPAKVDASLPPTIYPDRIVFAVRLPADTGGLPVDSVVMRYKEVADGAATDPLVHPFLSATTAVVLGGGGGGGGGGNRTQRRVLDLSLQDLKPNTLYRLAVLASNAVGESEPYMNLFRTPAKSGPFFDLFAPGGSPNATSTTTTAAAAVISGGGEEQDKREIYSCHRHDACLIRWRVVSGGGDELKSVAIAYSAVNPKTFAEVGRQRDARLPKPPVVAAEQHLLLTDLAPISIYRVKVRMTNKADLASERVFWVGTTNAPPGYQQTAAAAKVRHTASVWRLLLIISSTGIAVSVVFAAFLCCRGRRFSKDSADGHSNTIMTDGRTTTTDNLFADLGSDHNDITAFSVNSTLLDKNNSHSRRDIRSNNNNNQSPLTNSLLRNANINPLYSEAAALAKAPWNVFSTSPRASAGATDWTGGTGFSRV